MKEHCYYVYILSSNTETLYIGVTNNLRRRIFEHKEKLTKGFSEKYDVNRLVYYESHADVTNAIIREKQLKAWKRERKMNLIHKFNPLWNDLYETLAD